MSNSIYNPLYPPPAEFPYAPVAGFDFPPEFVIGNIFLSGAVEAGKTTLMDLLKAGLYRHFRAINLDAKGDDLPKLRANVGPSRVANLHVFDENALAWDIARDARTPAQRRALAYAFIPENPSAPYSHFWDSNARGIFVGEMEGFEAKSLPDVLATAMLHTELESGGPSWDIRDLIVACSPDILPRILEKTPIGRRVLKNVLTHKGTASDRPQDLISTLSSHLDRLIEVAQAARIHSNAGRRFSLLDFVDKKTPETVVRLALDAGSAEAWDPMLGIILRVLSRALLSRPVNEEKKLEFLMFADELQKFASVWPEIARFMAVSRTKACASIVATQHFQGLREAFNHPTAHLAFTDICKTHVYLRTESTEVAHHAADLFGQVTFWRNAPSVNESFAGSDSYGGNDGFARTQNERPHPSLDPMHGSHMGPTGSSTDSSGRNWSRGRTDTQGTGSQLQREVRPLLDYSELLNMPQPSRRTGMSCVVRHANRKWHIRINPAWIENRKVTPLGRPEARLDVNQLPFTPWTPEESARFLDPEPQGAFFAGIGEDSHAKQPGRANPKHPVGEGRAIQIPLPIVRRR